MLMPSLLALLLCLLVGVAAAAQPTPPPLSSQVKLAELKKLSIEELAETDITGSGRRPEQLEEVAAAVTVITSDDLRRYGVMNLPQALRLAETLHVAQVAGPGYAISERGFNITTANKMLVMIDGRTVYSPVFAGVFWEAQDLLIADIDRIEVLRGPGGSVWGANAVNGVIHVVMKNAADTRGTFVNAAAGTAAMGPFAVRHGGRFLTAGSYRVYGKVSQHEATELLAGGSAGNEHTFGQAGFRIESDRAGHNFAVLQGDLFSGDTGLGVGTDRSIRWRGGNLLARRMLGEIDRSQRERADLLEREQEANRLKDEFLATLSHELRTPLNAIVGWVHLLRTGSLPEDERRHALDRIDRNAHAQARLVQDLLDVSRITTGKLRLDIREMDFATVVMNAIDACRPAAEARQVTLATQFSGSFPTCGDPDRLQQVVWNLISNAVRFTPASGRVTISIARASGFDTLRVRDTGAGIESTFVPHVFEPFRQADAASTRAHGGLGIGLTIVRRLTEMHGGVVEVASDGPGLGATFTIRLPVRDTRAPNTVAVEPARVASLSGANVLVVDDDPDTLELLESTLRLAGAHPLPAASVAEALHVVADGHNVDAIVSDIAMPGQDGYTLITLLKDRMGAAMPAATLALTAYAGAADRKRALEAGFREHLAKPVNPTVLLQTLEDLLASSHTPRS